ncbi:hypothetical protein DFP72DRAFT_1040176 [Ephemerocybe angulata]|uniref:Uncharacterized protein n=1 Tax=Ephemerocybe angulata TaxID=980116 RepID=A0A8H6MG78_9AGAR|nr:hypothetical protein DFP72DRAFT_1040176 [Tulosesus angulatus]
MYFKFLVASFFALGAISAVVASPEPSALEKRQSSEIDIKLRLAVDNLKTAVAVILPKIDKVVATVGSVGDSIVPLLQELVDVLDRTAVTIDIISKTGQASIVVVDEIARAVALIYTDIIKCTNDALGKRPTFKDVFTKSGLEAALVKFLSSLNGVLSGVVKAISALLKLLSPVLNALGWTRLVAALNIQA